MIHHSPYPDVDIPNIPFTDFVLGRAAELSARPALIEGPTGRVVTFGQLAGMVRKVAAGLARRSFRKGDVFAIYSPNLPEYAVIFHAVATLGGINTTINPLYTADELAKQLNDSGARFLVTVGPFLGKARDAAAKAKIEEIFTFDGAAGSTPFATLAIDGAPPKVAIDPRRDLVVLPYSSGTTGLPKGVMLTHHNLVTNICQVVGFKDLRPLDETDTLIGVLPFFHIYGMVVIMSYGLSRGATVVTMPQFDLEQFLGLMQKHHVTMAHLVPPIVLGLAKHPVVDKFDLSALRVIFSGAAPLGAAVAQDAARRLDCQVIQGYGLTETSPVTHLSSDQPARMRPGSIGHAVPNSEVQIVDIVSGRPLGPKQEGEIWVRGPHVMQGYLNRPDATAQVIDADGWFRTGDIAYADQDGYFYIVDRLKELIKYKGAQVAPAELEALLLTHPDITDAAVIPSPDEEAGEVPKAYVVRKGNLSAEDVMAYVAGKVAPTKRVRLVEFIEQIPKSASGKILRRVLVDQERQRVAAQR
ncbi:MAG: 4-coumarate--CoA ligase family protein [Candidatus Lambdaproteobacteria bacterium]|nr:4-coumarate--CoA ligase family protein [Candidatus Lambdaproteobacteria bacterium]